MHALNSEAQRWTPAAARACHGKSAGLQGAVGLPADPDGNYKCQQDMHLLEACLNMNPLFRNQVTELTFCSYMSGTQAEKKKSSV